MVGHDHRVRQRLTDGGAVRRARVHSNDLDRVFPPRAAGVQPAQHGALGAPGGLAEQSLSAGKVDEVRLEPLGQPLPGVRVLAPGGPAASVSSIPSTRTGDGSASRASAWATHARCATGQLINSAHAVLTAAPSATSRVTCRRNRR